VVLGSLAERVCTSMLSATMKQDSRPMPNWPRNSWRAKPSSSRLDVRPTLERKVCTSSSVRPTPLSWNRTPPSSIGSMTTVPAGAAGSIARLAVIASVAFCRSSRAYTRGLA
jgi:hypothetical protein